MWHAPQFPGRTLPSRRDRGPSGSRLPSHRRAARPRLKALEGRALLSAWSVTNNRDDGSFGSLRYAITQVNGSSDTSNTITVDSTLDGGQTIMLSSALPPIAKNVSIVGPGAGLVSVSGNDHNRVFDISPGTTATISDLTITHGMADKNSPDVVCLGGGILNSGNLTLSDVVVSDSLAIGDASANPRYMNVPLGSGFAAGGGVFNGGILNVFDSTFTRDQARGGSGSSGHVSIGNFPGCAIGGGLANTGDATVEDSWFTSDLAQGGQGNHWDANPFAGVSGGGALASAGIITPRKATLTVSSSHFTNDQAVGGNDNQSIRDPGIALGGALFSHRFGNGADLTVNQCMFDDNQAIGGSYNSVSAPIVYTLGPNLASGSAAFISGTLPTPNTDNTTNVSDSTFDHNQAIGRQGVVGSNVGGVGEGHGGAITVGFAGTNVTVSYSRVEHNLAIGGQAVAGGNGGNARGGGIFNESGPQLTVRDSIIDQNQARGGGADTSGPASNGGNGLGGGVYNDSGTTTNVAGGSIAHNLAIGASGSNGGSSGAGQGGGFYNGGTATLMDGTVVVQNNARGADGTAGKNGADGLGGGMFNNASAMMSVTTASV